MIPLATDPPGECWYPVKRIFANRLAKYFRYRCQGRFYHGVLFHSKKFHASRNATLHVCYRFTQCVMCMSSGFFQVQTLHSERFLCPRFVKAQNKF